MFVVRYLMAAVVVIVAIVVGGIAAGFSAWAVAGIALLAVLVMQAGIIAYVVLAATHNEPSPPMPAKTPSDHLVIFLR